MNSTDNNSSNEEMLCCPSSLINFEEEDSEEISIDILQKLHDLMHSETTDDIDRKHVR